MTLQEKALKFLKEKGIYDSLAVDLSPLLVEFASQVAKTKLEEAAKSAQIMVLDDHDDVWEVVTELNLYGGYRVIVDYQGIVKTKLD